MESCLADEKEKHEEMKKELAQKEAEKAKQEGSAQKLAEDIDSKISDLREKLKAEGEKKAD